MSQESLPLILNEFINKQTEISTGAIHFSTILKDTKNIMTHFIISEKNDSHPCQTLLVISTVNLKSTCKTLNL